MSVVVHGSTLDSSSYRLCSPRCMSVIVPDKEGDENEADADEGTKTAKLFLSPSSSSMMIPPGGRVVAL